MDKDTGPLGSLTVRRVRLINEVRLAEAEYSLLERTEGAGVHGGDSGGKRGKEEASAGLIL